MMHGQKNIKLYIYLYVAHYLALLFTSVDRASLNKLQNHDPSSSLVTYPLLKFQFYIIIRTLIKTGIAWKKVRGKFVVGWDVVTCSFGGTCCFHSIFPKYEGGSFLRNVVTSQNDVAHHSFNRSQMKTVLRVWINAERYKTNPVFVMKGEIFPILRISAICLSSYLIAELDFYDPVGLVPDYYLQLCNLSLTGIQGRCEDIGTATLASPVFLAYG